MAIAIGTADDTINYDNLWSHKGTFDVLVVRRNQAGGRGVLMGYLNLESQRSVLFEHTKPKE